jgi:putative ABC transport system permease protein
MWLITARDLQFRLRRFVIAVLVTSIVFGMALVFDGIKRALQAEVPRVVQRFDADRWVVADGASGPFTTSQAVPSSLAAQLREEPGVRAADPVVITRSVVEEPSGKEVDVNVIGFPPGGLGTSELDDGRQIRRRGEAVITKPLEAAPGDEVRLGGKRLKVVGFDEDARYNFGLPTVFVTLADAQALSFDGRELAMGIPVAGRLDRAPPGFTLRTNAQVEADMRRVIRSGVQTIDFTSLLLWLVAAGIIGSIVYMTALERVRDFAVFKATGVPLRTIGGGLVTQTLILALAAAVLAIAVANLMALGLPFPADIGAGGISQLVAIAVVVGIVASLAGLRRSVAVDPALAFGGA